MPSKTPQPLCSDGVSTWTRASSQSTYSPSIQILPLGVIGIVALLLVWRPAARDGGGDPVPERLGRVSRSPWQGRYSPGLERGRGASLPQVVEEQGGRQDGGHRVGPAGAGDVG